MKKALYLFIALLFAFPVQAQKLKVKRTKKMKMEQNAWNPVFGSSNTELLLTQQNYDGLRLYNIRTGKETVISKERAAGYNVKAGKKNIDFSVVVGSRGDRKTEYMTYRRKEKKVEKRGKSASTLPAIKVNGAKLELMLSDREPKILQPVEGRNYIWASLSPDNKRILFTAVGKGTYVCDLEGKILFELGKINSPSWINDSWVVGAKEEDDGHMLTSSDIIAHHIGSGSIKQITEGDIYISPDASPGSNRIAYCNMEGEVFITRIRVR